MCFDKLTSEWTAKSAPAKSVDSLIYRMPNGNGSYLKIGNWRHNVTAAPVYSICSQKSVMRFSVHNTILQCTNYYTSRQLNKAVMQHCRKAVQLKHAYSCVMITVHV